MPGPADVFRATQAQNAKQSPGGEASTALAERLKSPSEKLLESGEGHAREIGGAAIHLDQIVSEPQVVPVHHLDTAPEDSSVFTIPEATFQETTSVDAIPDDVVAEVAATLGTAEEVPVEVLKEEPEAAEEVIETPKQSRKDFVAQQEELFGKNDEIKAEDVPAGEMTYAQYLAQRPVAAEDDLIRTNGVVRNAQSGAFAKKADYEEKVDSYNATKANDYYNETADKAILEADHEEGLKEAVVKDRAYDSVIRENTEGEFLIKSDKRLQGLLQLGEEVNDLYHSDVTKEGFEALEPELEAKKAIYNDLYQLYSEKGLDSRALGYINDKTFGEVEDEDFIAIEGSPFLNGEKVEILEVLEPENGKKSYTIEKEDGSIEAVYAEDITFKREFDPVVVEEPEQEKKSLFERIKNKFKDERQKFQEYGGWAYFNGLFTATGVDAGNWLRTRGVNEDMDSDAEHAQQQKNRRNKILGNAAKVAGGVAGLVLITVIAEKTGALDSLSHLGQGGGHSEAAQHLSQGYFGNKPSLEHGMPNVTEVITPKLPEGVDLDLSNSAYDIPSGGSVTQMFDKLDIDTSKIAQNADILRARFPDEFGGTGVDVRINHSGVLSEQARTFIEGLR